MLDWPTDLIAALCAVVAGVLGALRDSVWAILVSVLVPIAAAGIAAGVVTRQIRQLDRHRDDDRRASAVRALTRMLYREFEFGTDPELYRRISLLRFQNGEELITAYATLPPADHDVARWVAAQRNVMQSYIDSAGDEMNGRTLGSKRAAAASIAAHAAEELMMWQRGEKTTESFSRRLYPIQGAGGLHDLSARFGGWSDPT